MKWMLMIAAAALVAQPAAAHTPSATKADAAAVRSVLSTYKSAIERLDANGTERLFTTDSAVFETGGVEGNYANYLAHHLTPELAEFKSFRYSNYKIEVRCVGPVALATESYRYRIETKKGEATERLGVATSVLTKVKGSWKILSMHNSARRPKAS
ncbi:MAG: nuclear transport factor 2 family protein [Sphingomonas bacterium]|nr:nuclear transport factor 2 family protein [Sphingomonas bacterium]